MTRIATMITASITPPTANPILTSLRIVGVLSQTGLTEGFNPHRYAVVQQTVRGLPWFYCPDVYVAWARGVWQDFQTLRARPLQSLPAAGLPFGFRGGFFVPDQQDRRGNRK